MQSIVRKWPVRIFPAILMMSVLALQSAPTGASLPRSPRSSDVHAGAVSCANSTVCTLVGAPVDGSGAVILRTTDGGSTWHRQSPPAGISGLTAVSCPTTKFCLATGGGPSTFTVATTSDGGITWIGKAGVGVSSWIDAVDCLTPTNCYAEGFAEGWAKGMSGLALLRSRNAGTTWSLLVFPAGGNTASSTTRASLSCPSTVVCYTVRPVGNLSTFDVFTTMNGGSTGKTVLKGEDAAPHSPIGIACWLPTACMVTGAYRGSRVLVTANGGKSWTTYKLPAVDVNGVGVQCLGARRCVVIAETHSGFGAALTANAGIRWSTSAVATVQSPTADEFIGMSCIAAGTCRAMLQTRTTSIYSSIDGGHAWQKAHLP